MSVEQIGDITLAVVIGYIAIGFVVMMIETAAEGKFYNGLLYGFLKLDRTNFALFVFLSCVGAWPMVVLYEIFARKKK